MFQPDPSSDFLMVDPSSIVALYKSVNITTVSLPGLPSAPAKAVVVGYKVQDPAGAQAFHVKLALHLVDTGRHVTYVLPEPWLDAPGARDAAKAAIAFIESMGFFSENVNWRNLDPVAQAELVASLKVFQPPLAAAEAGRKVVDPRVKLARLLVQF